MSYTKFTRVESQEFKGPVTGNVIGDVTGDMIKGTVLTAVSLTAGALTMTAAQAKAARIEVTAGSATNAIVVPTGLPGKIYCVVNGDGVNAALIKVAGGTAVTVAAGKTALVQVNGAGTEVTRLTADV